MIAILLTATLAVAEYSYKTNRREPILTHADKAHPSPSLPSPAASPKAARLKIPGNLPAYFVSRSSGLLTSDAAFVLVPEKKDSIFLRGLRAGDVLFGELEQAITASPNVPSPVRVRVSRGEYKGSFLLGMATLDKDLQRVLIEITRLRLKDRDTPYALKAQVLSPSGEVGLVGEFHSKEALFFLAEMASATAAGYADATIQRSQNQFGTYQQAPSVENAAKLGVVNAMSRSADRFAEKQRSSPGYTTTEGFREVKVIITDDPTEAN